jgi:hypothetical protein
LLEPGALARRQKDRYKGGHKAWIAEVDAVPLESITPELLRAWKKDYVNRAGRDELARRRLVVNVNSDHFGCRVIEWIAHAAATSAIGSSSAERWSYQAAHDATMAALAQLGR